MDDRLQGPTVGRNHYYNDTGAEPIELHVHSFLSAVDGIMGNSSTGQGDICVR